MRIASAILFLCGFSCFATAQIRSGDQFITLERPGSLNGPAPLFTAEDFGGFTHSFERDLGILTLAPTYGYAVTDRLVVGGTPVIDVAVIGGEYWGLGLEAYLRYYVINRERLGVYGEVSSGMRTSIRQGFSALDQANLRAGLQLPLASGIRVGPALDYSVRSGRNYLSLGGQIEIVLNGERSGEESPDNHLRAGSVMLGGQLAEVGVSKFLVYGGVNLGGYYFLTDRFAAGLSLGVEGGRIHLSPTREGPILWPHRLSVGLSTRYYLVSTGRMVWYAEAGAGYGRFHQAENTQHGIPVQRSRYASVTAAAAGQYFVRHNVALELGPQWRRQLEVENAESTLSMTGGIRFFLQ